MLQSDAKSTTSSELDQDLILKPWRTTVFSWKAWQRYIVVFFAAIAIGAIVSLFAYADQWSIVLRGFLTGQQTFLNWKVTGIYTEILPALLVFGYDDDLFIFT